MEGRKKRMGRSNQNEGEGEGPRKGREIRKPLNEDIDDNALSEEEVRALVKEGVRRLEGLRVWSLWWLKGCGEFDKIQK